MALGETKMKQATLAALVATVMVSACAATPESIGPSYVSEMTYQNWTCEQLVQEMGRLNAAYTTAADQQHKARSNDTVGVIFLGLPVSSLSGGNVAAQVASIKGNQAAVERAATLKSCAGVTAQQRRG
jgi:hypothetical protein